MKTAEYLPDNINMMNEAGDVVARDNLFEQPDQDEVFPDPVEADRSPDFLLVEDMIRSGIEASRAGGFAVLKVKSGERYKPLEQFMATDLFSHGLSSDEINELLEKYLPGRAKAVHSLGNVATAGAGEKRMFDVRELASGYQKEFDD